MHAQFLKTPLDLSRLWPVEEQFILVLPYIDHERASKTIDILCSRAGIDGLIVAVHDAAREGFIAIANLVYRNSKSEFFGYLAEDAFPGRNWGKRALSALKDENAGLLAFNDGKWAGFLAAFGVARRSWADRNYCGDLFHPGYRSHYADAELTLLAMTGKAYRYDANCVMIEVDYDKDGKPTRPEDKRLFDERKKACFEGRVENPDLLNLYR